MITKTTLATLAFVIASPAFAASQLEMSAGVEAGEYTHNEISQIVLAEDETEAERLKKLLAGAGAPAVSRIAAGPTFVFGDGSNQGSNN